MPGAEIIRRSFMKVFGTGVAGVGLGFSANLPATASPASDTNHVGKGMNPVNLYALTSTVRADAEGKGALVVRVGNNGPRPTLGPVALTVITPFFVNIDRSGALPANSRVLFEDERPNMPEILQCTIPPGLAPGAAAEQRLTIPMVVLPKGPSRPLNGRVTVACQPVEGRPLDQDTNLENAARPIAVLTPATAGQKARRAPDNAVNLYFRYEFPALTAGVPSVVNVLVGNAGPNPATTDALFTMRTPYYVNIAAGQPLPPGARVVYKNSSPAVPEVLTAPVPARSLTVGSEYPLRIPLVSVSGGPSGYRSAGAIVVPGKPDVDIDLNPSVHSIGLVLLN